MLREVVFREVEDFGRFFELGGVCFVGVFGLGVRRVVYRRVRVLVFDFT